MSRPRRRELVPLPLFDVEGSPPAPAPVLDLGEVFRLTCIRYGVTPTGKGLPGPSTRYPLRCAWPAFCPFLHECACPITAGLREQLREESTP